MFLALATCMPSQYIGDKVSKSSSPDPRKFFFLVCHVTISVVLIGWAVGATARQHGRALVSKFYQLICLRAMVNGWEKESMSLFVVDRVFWRPKGSPRQKSWPVQKTLSTSKRVMDSLNLQYNNYVVNIIIHHLTLNKAYVLWLVVP